MVRNSVHFLMSFHLDNWQHWELNAQNHVFVSNFSSYRHRRKRDVKLTAGLIRHAIYIVAYTANINSLLIGWLADWLTDWLTDWHADGLTDPPTDLLTDWLTVWRTDWDSRGHTSSFILSLKDWQADSYLPGGWLFDPMNDSPGYTSLWGLRS